MLRIDLQHILDFLERQLILAFLKSAARRLDQARGGSVSQSLVNPSPQWPDLRVEVTLGLQFGKDFGGVVRLVFIERSFGPLEARLESRGVESFDVEAM
jgi:hypothetical protein